jgi:hypothetical protein
MTLRSTVLVFGALAALVALPALAARDDSERERLAQERRAIERRYDEQDVQCRERFAVTSCLDESRRERRDALADVTARQIALDDAERQRRAQARRERIERKGTRHAAEAPPQGGSAAGGAASASAP